MGFGVSVDSWVRGPLREWWEDMLASSRLLMGEYFDNQAISRRWSEHLKGKQNWRDSLWMVLILQAWLNQNNN